MPTTAQNPLSEEIDGLTKRIDAIRKAQLDSESRADRLALLQETLDEREKHKFEYDDSIVRQMIECIKVYHDSHIEVIFGGGYTVEEALEPNTSPSPTTTVAVRRDNTQKP